MNRIPADTDPRSAFYLGQVVLCHVLSCEPDQMRLRLSLKVCWLIITTPALLSTTVVSDGWLILVKQARVS